MPRQQQIYENLLARVPLSSADRSRLMTPESALVHLLVRVQLHGHEFVPGCEITAGSYALSGRSSGRDPSSLRVNCVPCGCIGVQSGDQGLSRPGQRLSRQSRNSMKQIQPGIGAIGSRSEEQASRGAGNMCLFP